MELIEAIKLRKSIRGYKPTPVPKETLAQILEIATRSPSALNTQPWKFTILGGKVLDELKEALQEQFLAGVEMHPDFPLSPLPSGIYRTRQVDLAKGLFQLLDIAREDKGKRTEWTARAFRFFDAPNAIIVSMDGEIDNFSSIFSLGIISQTIALVAVNFGLGTCIEQNSALYPEVIRKITGIPESQIISVGMAIGYPDWDFPANKLQSAREPLSNIATWHGV
jgi:nitroreductase